ncbi:MXAN_6230/SCO0854 family RING domain-containing protein [Yinghuangia seranimata]|uniref:MXAN_6230/SCO0854 family RING domain-containing protein n=1 Tax=Yinghuangia seranimata TaxID=408067 RepID=UPI00248BEE7A|nr:MXAN_6230/SCO0854 family RING domain-containing protein [Yinghuangia seranimata]MDI2128303.1 hypothetical protein [Yinghuangia seranimata]
MSTPLRRGVRSGSVTTAHAADDVDGILLRRLGTVYPGGGTPDDARGNAAGVVALEADLGARGHALTRELRDALVALAPVDLAGHGMRTLGRVDALLGADRTHQPLFSGFPHSVPPYAHAAYSAQMREFLLSQPHQPCLICCATGDVGALASCGHIVCSPCLAREAQLTACPVCGAEMPNVAYPYLSPARDVHGPRAEGVLRLLRLGVDRDADAYGQLLELLGRRTPLNPRDRGDLGALTRHIAVVGVPAGVVDLADEPAAESAGERAADARVTDPAVWLPADVPIRASKAAVLALLLDVPSTAASARALLAGRLDTATDVLRLLWAYSGADPDLVTAPSRLRALPRPLRRELVGVIDGLPFEYVAEDLPRHRQAWLRAAEVLHPFEYARKHPRAAVAFAALRGTRLADDAFGRSLRAAAAALPVDVVEVDESRGGLPAVRLVARTFASRVEQALYAGDVDAAVEELAKRPGEFVRRLHQLLRVHQTVGGAGVPETVAAALARTLPRAAPGPLLGALGRLRVSRELGERRVWFPRGEASRAVGFDDWEPPVPAAASAPVVARIEAELLRRATRRPSVDVAVLDRGLEDLVAPFAVRTAAKALVEVPRGSVQAMPASGRVRLFLHWMEPPGVRVDLDLSVALFGEDWSFHGMCDYTRLVYGDGAAVHSGDLTSAPAPRGASEFVDLDLPALARLGARHAVVVVFSYNNIAFEELLDAFAGFIDLDTFAGETRVEAFDPRGVTQRFDLAGPARISVPMVVDLATRNARWTDLNLDSVDGAHSVARHHEALAALVRDVHSHFKPGARATLWDLARLSAAARADEVHVRELVDSGVDLRTYRRRPDELREAFAARLAGPHADRVRLVPVDQSGAVLAEEVRGRDALLALVHGDVPVEPDTPRGALYRLYPGVSDTAPDRVTRLAAADLIADFGPDEG